MGLYKLVGTRFEEIPQPPIQSEKQLENWLKKDLSPLIDGENLLFIGRQLQTEFGQFNDLLAVDRDGNCAVIELKRIKGLAKS